MSTPKSTIKTWFQTYMKPTQAQFEAWLDSYWHKDDTIPIANIDTLSAFLAAKASNSYVTDRIGQQDFEATEGQTEFTITDFVVVPGKTSLIRDGSFQPLGQIDTTAGQVITLNTPASLNELITFKQ